MSIEQLTKLIGRRALYKLPVRGKNKNFQVKVSIQAVRQSFQRFEAFIIPESGSGNAWVDFKFLTIEKVGDIY